ncbi:MAG TPA: IS110 family transposase [Alphaproteobacteria bacterium]|nr:IS110 family transposase [Alphaproteobacteria bacterium]
MSKSSTTAGIDASKPKLDIAIHGRPEHWQVENSPAGWRQLLQILKEAGVSRVGIEATGGYERGVVDALRNAGFTVLVLQPIQVKAYARLRLRRAKNDKIDAVLIAACAATLDPPKIAPDKRLAQLARLLTFVEQIDRDIVRLKTRLEHIDDARLQRMVLSDIARLDLRRAAELGRIAKTLRMHEDLARRFELVLSVPGIGERTAITLIVRLPELGRVSREEIAALAGLAPFDDDSGTRKGQRRTAGGRSQVRRALYNAALPACHRWNKALIRLYASLMLKGKLHKVALVACARKLLIYANTVVQRGTPWVQKPEAT